MILLILKKKDFVGQLVNIPLFFCENEQNLYNKALLMEVYNSEVFSDVLDF